MDAIDRDLERAEYEASRAYSAQSPERRQSAEKARRTSIISSSGTSATTSSISTRPDLHQRMSMGRATTVNTTNDLERRRTHPVEMHRTETHRLQHSHTVGASITKTRTSQKPLPNFGGGKPYPPALPDQDEYVVEYDGKDDPLHPQNWSLSRK
jgi:MFS transporter, DHA1 family, multidrug resistance protein